MNHSGYVKFLFLYGQTSVGDSEQMANNFLLEYDTLRRTLSDEYTMQMDSLDRFSYI